MHIAGYLAAVLIGVSLGLIGGGGSILTVPVLVYLFGINPLLSTSYSLFVVGSTSLVGAFNNYRKGLVSIKTAFLFGLSSITTVFLTRKFIIPAIPKNIAEIGGFTITESIFTMVLFAILMVIASISMIRNGSIKENVINNKKINLAKLLVYGTAIGFVTGLLGAGGGFLIIPALVLLCKLDMKHAIGTSMLIITLNSLFGFMGDIGNQSINWLFLFTITGIAIAGLLIGSHLNSNINSSKLKKGFGWFVLAMGIFVLLKELL